MQHIELLRAVRIGGQHKERREIVEVSDELAKDMIRFGTARAVDPGDVPAVAPHLPTDDDQDDDVDQVTEDEPAPKKAVTKKKTRSRKS